MPRKRTREVCIGTSGWSYKHWKENFYPEGSKPADWLHFYSQIFPTVEINTTFYHTPRVSTVKNWYAQVPKEFSFAIKMNRYITHRKKLHECKEPLKIFYQSIEKLKTKTGPILVQLPPSFKANKERLLEFIKLLKKKYRYTFEFRHESWFVDEIFDILAKYNIALCITDLNGSLSPEVITADFVYIRLHGPKKAYQGTYGPRQLKKWGEKLKKWNQKYAIYCYFDNDEKGYAIQDAKYLLAEFIP